MMNRVIGIILVLLLGTTADCLGTVDAGTITIGVAGPKPKDAQQGNARYAQNALELFNKDFAGKLGKRLRVEIGDVSVKLDFVYKEYESVSEAVDVAEEFAHDDTIAAVIGFPASAKATQVGKVFDANKLVLITPTATNPTVTRGHDYVFSMIYTDDRQGAVIAAYMAKLQGWKRVALVYQDAPKQDTVYERGLAESFQAAAKDYGVRITDILRTPADLDLNRIFVDSEDSSKSSAPDAVALFATSDEAPEMVLKIRQRDARVPIVVPDGLSGRTFLSETRTIHEALHLSDPRMLVANRLFYELAPLKAGEFRRAYQSAYNNREPEIYEVFTYDAAYLITWAAMNAIRAHGGARPSTKDLRIAIKRNLMKLNCRRRALTGISGQLYFDSEGALMRNVLFAWVANVETPFEEQKERIAAHILTPAYVQLKDVSINDCEGHVKAPVRSAAEPTSPVTDGIRPSPRNNPDRVVIRGREMKKVYVVRTGMDFYRINDIDLSKQRFDIETFVWFRWKGPLEILPAARGQNLEDILLFWNGIHGLEDKTDLLITENQPGNEVKSLAFKVKGTYVQHYALQKYPFDTQNLSIYLSLANKNTDEVWLVVDNGTVQSTKEIAQRYDENNLKIFPGEYAPTKSEHLAGTTALPSSLGNPRQKRSGGSANDFSVYEASLEVKRDMFPYFLTLFLPLGILTAVSLGVFWIPLAQFAVRITIVLTTLLSVLVFHLSRSDSLPNVGYLTVADKFFMAAYIGMSINIGLTILYEWLRTRKRKEFVEELNGVVRYILVAATIVFIAVVGSPAVERLVGEERYWTVMISLLALWAAIEIVVRSTAVRSRLAAALHLLTFRKAKEAR